MINRRRFFQSSLAAAVAYALPAPRLFALDQAASQAAGGLAAVKLDGSATVIGQADLAALKSELRGALLVAGDPGYEEARRVLNRSIDRRPALVVQPSGAADVRSVVDFARERELLVAVKCGGHSYGGKSTCDGGLQIDLSRMRGAWVEPVARTVHVEGGSLLGEIDHEAMALELVTTAGTVSHTGVGGLTLGGGFGRLARRYGLAVDNLRAVDIVTADGRLLRASADENPDLFWGVRGGGGNFGVVTRFEFALHPMQRQVVGGDFVFPLERARELLGFYAEYSASVPREMYFDAFMGAPPGGKPGAFVLSCCWSGDAAQAEAVLAPVRKLGKPIADTVQARDYVAVQRMHDRADPRNEGQYLKSGFIRGFNPALIDAIVTGFQGDPQRGTALFFQHGGGAVGDVAADATAFPHRYASHNMLTAVTWPLEIDRTPHVDYLKGLWRSLEPHARGYYMNEVADEAQAVVDENYQGNIGRMRAVKKQYDPKNLFRLNANVQPS
jgi:FAD/FMN-containing dehydrogenase